jgi:hypothetical protein
VTLPPLPTVTLPPLPTVTLPPLPTVTLPPLPTVTLPPLPTVTLPPLPTVTLPPLPTVTVLPTITVIPSIDTDGDGCQDAREIGLAHQTGGQRNPLNPYDFYDVPVPALTSSDPTGMKDHVVSIADVISVVAYIGTSATAPTTLNSMGLSYGSDLDGNAMLDGTEYDRSPSVTPGQPWDSGPPSGAVTIADALIALQQVGDNCS